MPISYVVSGFYKALFYSEKIEGEIQEDAIVNNNIFKMIFGKQESLLATVQKKMHFWRLHFSRNKGDQFPAAASVQNSISKAPGISSFGLGLDEDAAGSC